MKTQSLKEYLARKGISNPFLAEHWHLMKRRWTSDKVWNRLIKDIWVKQRVLYKEYHREKESYYRLVEKGIIREYTISERLDIACDSNNKIQSEAANRVLKKRLLHKNKTWQIQ